MKAFNIVCNWEVQSVLYFRNLSFCTMEASLEEGKTEAQSCLKTVAVIQEN